MGELVRSHDALFRLVFGDEQQCGELLRSRLDPALAAAIDWPSLRRLDVSFTDVDLSTSRADLLFAARLGDGIVLLHVVVEHKSGDDRFTVLQLLRYRLRVWDRWRREHPAEQHLPPLLTIVVHHGERPWSSPRALRELVDLRCVPGPVAAAVQALQPEAPYLLDDLAAETEQQLTDRRLSVVADLTLRFLQFLRRRSVEDAADDIARWQCAVRLLLDHPRGQEVMAALFSWFLAAVPRREEAMRTVLARLDDPVTRQTMKSMLDDLLEQGFVKGHAKGRAKGRAEGRREGTRAGRLQALEQVLRARFGALPEAVAERLRDATAADLARWTLRAVTAPSLDAVFARA